MYKQASLKISDIFASQCRKSVLFLTHDDEQSRKTLESLRLLLDKHAPRDAGTLQPSSPAASENFNVVIHPRPFCIVKLRLSTAIWDRGYDVSNHRLWPTIEIRDENIVSFVKSVIEMSPARVIIFVVRPDEIVRMRRHRILSLLKYTFSSVLILHSDPKSAFASQALKKVPPTSMTSLTDQSDSPTSIVRAVQKYICTWSQATQIVRETWSTRYLTEHYSHDIEGLTSTFHITNDKEDLKKSNNLQASILENKRVSDKSWDNFLHRLPLNVREEILFAFHNHHVSPFSTTSSIMNMNCTIPKSNTSDVQKASQRLRSPPKHLTGDDSTTNEDEFSIAFLLPAIKEYRTKGGKDCIQSMFDAFEKSVVWPEKYKITTYVYTTSSSESSNWNRYIKQFPKLRIAVLYAGELNVPSHSYASIWAGLARKAAEENHSYFALLSIPWVPQNLEWISLLRRLFQSIQVSANPGTGLENRPTFGPTLEKKFGLVAITSGYSFTNPVSVLVMHSHHLKIFPELLPQPFHDFSVAPEDAFAFLRTLYYRFNIADTLLMAPSIGRQHSPHRTIRYKGEILSRCLQSLSNTHLFGPSLKTVDVVVPTFRLPERVLQSITSLRTTTRTIVRFWIIVDNPKEHLKVLALMALLDGVHQNGNYIVTIVNHPENLGAARARNTGLSWSDADWIIMLDDDVDPHPRLLDAYIAAIIRNPDARILTGVINFPKPQMISHHALVASGLLYFFSASQNIPHMPWPITANTCVRACDNKNFLFLDYFPKGGGGEDIDFGLRIKGNDPASIVSVGEAQVSHPWFGHSFKAISAHLINYMKGDSVIESMLEDKTFIVLPGWAELIALCFPFMVLFGKFSTALVWATIVVLMELLCRATTAALPSYVSTGNVFISIPVALVAALFHMAQDCSRVFYSIQRKSWRPFLNRLDRFDGLRDMRSVQLAMGLRTIGAIVILFWCLEK